MSSPIKPSYGSQAAVTITLASLASDTSFLTGRSSTLIDNTSNLNLDYLISGKITTGTSPTAGVIEVFIVAPIDSTPTWPDGAATPNGTDGACTWTSLNIKNSVCRPVWSALTSSTANQAYPFGPVSVASLFGGVCPTKFLVFVDHSTVAVLNATSGNHEIVLMPVGGTVG